MEKFIEITVPVGQSTQSVTLAIDSITHIEPNTGGKAVIYVSHTTIPYVTDTETYATFIARLP